MNLPFAIVINRYGIGNDEVEKFCKAEKIDICLKLPDDRRIAEAYSTGQMMIDEFDEYKRVGLELGFDHIESGPLVRSSYHADEQFNGQS